mmetsp:Transcript_66206/g.113828  ORF Transcript_66206/g.113828 Transcript_66206/m.113828 type:complete len:283 (+) Transcript_66206:333-1181(+)
MIPHQELVLQHLAARNEGRRRHCPRPALHLLYLHARRLVVLVAAPLVVLHRAHHHGFTVVLVEQHRSHVLVYELHQHGVVFHHHQRRGLLLRLFLQRLAVRRRVLLTDDQQLPCNGHLGRLRLLQVRRVVPALLHVVGDHELHEARQVRKAVLVVARRLLQRLRFLRHDPILHADGRVGVREQGGAASHAGVELLGNEGHARSFPGLGEEVRAQIPDAGDELGGVGGVLLLRSTRGLLCFLCKQVGSMLLSMHSRRSYVGRKLLTALFRHRPQTLPSYSCHC